MPTPTSKLAVLAITFLWCGACSTTYEETSLVVDSAYRAGDYEGARAATADLLRIKDGEYAGNGGPIEPSTAALLDLEMAVLDLASGYPVWAETRSALARDKLRAMFDAGFERGFLGNLQDYADALIAEPDLTRGSYYGSDWEQVLSLSMAGAAGLARGRADLADAAGNSMTALASELLAAWQELCKRDKEEFGVETDASAQKFVMTGLPFFLQGISLEAIHNSAGYAKDVYQTALAYEERNKDSQFGRQPEVEQGLRDHLNRATATPLASTQTARVWVLCLTDRLPALGASELKRSVLIQNIAKFVGAALGMLKPEQLPEFTAIEVARPVEPEAPFVTVEVALDGSAPQPAALVSDLLPTLQASFERSLTPRITRALILRIAKFILAEGTKVLIDEKLRKNDPWLAQILNYVVEGLRQLWTSAERPDTRSWRHMPRRCYCLRLELPLGEQREVHRITIRARSATGAIVERAIDCDLRNDEDSFVFSVLPDVGTPTAIYWASEQSDMNGLAFVVPPGGTDRIPISAEPLDRESPTGHAVQFLPGAMAPASIP